jgi:CheY-like chemotaxis protein
MFILYGDDEKIAREVVKKALSSWGYDIFTLDTSRTEEMTTHLAELCQQYGTPDVFIIDGHNILLDNDGNKLYDMTPLGLVTWLRQNGLTEQCKLILYSNDDRLVELARNSRSLQFFDAISKGGSTGGLTALISCVNRANTVLRQQADDLRQQADL